MFIALGLGLGLLAGLLVLELVFGNWLRQDRWLATRQLNIIRQQRIVYDVRNIHGHDRSQVVYTRDAFGLRGSCARPQDIEILTLGGSTTDQRLINDGQTWQDVLQREIERTHARTVCVSNAGVDGHSTFGHILSLQRWFPLIEGLRPRLYVLYIGINDAGLRLAPSDGFDTYNPQDVSIPPRSLLENSAFYQLMLLGRSVWASGHETAMSAYAGHAKRPPLPEAYTATHLSEGLDALIEQNNAAFTGRLNAIIDEVTRRNGKVVCVSQPHLFVRNTGGRPRGTENAFEFQGRSFNGLDYAKSITRLNQTMKTLCPQRGGYFIDIASQPFSGDDFYDLVHNTPQGAARVGHHVFQELDRLHLFDGH